MSLFTPNPANAIQPLGGDELTGRDELMREITELREGLSRLSEAGLRISGDMDFNTVLQGVLDDTDIPTYIFTEPRVGYRMPKGEKVK